MRRDYEFLDEKGRTIRVLVEIDTGKRLDREVRRLRRLVQRARRNTRKLSTGGGGVIRVTLLQYPREE